MKHLLLVVSFFCMSETIFAQSNLAQRLFDAHDLFREKSVSVRREFKHRHLVPLIERLKTSPNFAVSEAGKSFEGRGIYQIKYGKGAPPVLLWSQMHGDEAPATMVLTTFVKSFWKKVRCILFRCLIPTVSNVGSAARPKKLT